MKRRMFLRHALATSVATGLAARAAFAAEQVPRVNAERLNSRLRELARFGRNSKGGIDRVAYSEADVAARQYVMDLMRQAALHVRVDAAGNIIGMRRGRDAARAPLLYTVEDDRLAQIRVS